jgi:hypothetical protein
LARRLQKPFHSIIPLISQLESLIIIEQTQVNTLHMNIFHYFNPTRYIGTDRDHDTREAYFI